MKDERITIKVQRHDPDGDGGRRIEVYSVEKKDRMTVLEALIQIKKELEPGLSFPHSCKYDNSCKLCLALISGKVDYLCMVEAVDGTEVRPLPGKDILRDLVVRPRKRDNDRG